MIDGYIEVSKKRYNDMSDVEIQVTYTGRGPPEASQNKMAQIKNEHMKRDCSVWPRGSVQPLSFPAVPLR